MSQTLIWPLVVVTIGLLVGHASMVDRMVNELRDTGEERYADPLALSWRKTMFGWKLRSKVYEMHRERFPGSNLRVKSRIMGISSFLLIVAVMAMVDDRTKERRAHFHNSETLRSLQSLSR